MTGKGGAKHEREGGGRIGKGHRMSYASEVVSKSKCKGCSDPFSDT